MSKHTLLALAISLAVVPVAGATSKTGTDPGMKHRVFMAGAILESSSHAVRLCIGTPEGAKVGQELAVERIVRDTTLNPKLGARFKHVRVGTVKVDAIVDQHFAEASVVSGSALKGDVARLSDSMADSKNR